MSPQPNPIKQSTQGGLAIGDWSDDAPPPAPGAQVVTVAGPQAGDVPEWNGSEWVPEPNVAGTPLPFINANDPALGLYGDGVHDDSAAWQAIFDTLIDAGGGQVYIPAAKTYLLGTALDWSFLANAAITGGGPLATTTFQWAGGEGSGPMIKAYGINSVIVERLNFSFTDTAYDGNLIEQAWSPVHAADCIRATWRDCGFGVSNCQTPRSMLSWDRTIISRIEHCHFFGGQYAIILGDTNYAIQDVIRECDFNNTAVAHILINGGPTEAITIDANTFEPLASGAAGAILCSASGRGTRGLMITNNWLGDISTPGGTYIDVNPAAACIISGNRFYGTTDTPAINLQDEASFVVIMANDFQTDGDTSNNDVITGSLSSALLLANNYPLATAGFIEPFSGLANANTDGQIPASVIGWQAFLKSGGVSVPSDGYWQDETRLILGFGAPPTPGLLASAQILSDSNGQLYLVPGAGGNGGALYAATDDTGPGVDIYTALAWSGGGSGTELGFMGAAAAPRQTVSGAKAGNAALASLITALATLGLITDDTT